MDKGSTINYLRDSWKFPVLLGVFLNSKKTFLAEGQVSDRELIIRARLKEKNVINNFFNHPGNHQKRLEANLSTKKSNVHRLNTTWKIRTFPVTGLGIMQYQRWQNYPITLNNIKWQLTFTVRSKTWMPLTNHPLLALILVLAPWSCSRTMIEGFAHW